VIASPRMARRTCWL